MPLVTVVNSVLPYDAPWGHQAGNKMVVKYMGPAERKMALRDISGYRSISQSEALILAGMTTIWLLPKEKII